MAVAEVAGLRPLRGADRLTRRLLRAVGEISRRSCRRSRAAFTSNRQSSAGRRATSWLVPPGGKSVPKRICDASLPRARCVGDCAPRLLLVPASFPAGPGKSSKFIAVARKSHVTLTRQARAQEIAPAGTLQSLGRVPVSESVSVPVRVYDPSRKGERSSDFLRRTRFEGPQGGAAPWHTHAFCPGRSSSCSSRC